jgi:hypothetical protein
MPMVTQSANRKPDLLTLVLGFCGINQIGTNPAGPSAEISSRVKERRRQSPSLRDKIRHKALACEFEDGRRARSVGYFVA